MPDHDPAARSQIGDVPGALPRIHDVARALEAWAPPGTAQSYDNVGLQVGDAEREVRAALIALDLVPAVVDEAVRLGATLIVTHHPLIFRPLRSVTAQDWNGGLALRLAEAGIALYGIHTNLDAAPAGVSFALAETLGLVDLRFLDPVAGAPSETGLGVVGRLEAPEPLRAFLRRVAARLGASGLRYTGDLDARVATVAVCGGAGSDLASKALRAGADAYVTADVTYHRFFDVLGLDGRPRMALIDAGHYETEAMTERLLRDWLRERFPAVTWHQTTVRTSPVATFTPG